MQRTSPRVSLASAFLCILLQVSATAAQASRSLTFEDRVAAQESIERVYYAHQIGATQPFEQAMPRQVLERKVRTYLEQSVALEEFWRTPVTSDMLRAELARMAASTRLPDRLEEIYRALRHDPLLVEECYARPVLVDRLARNFFAHDPLIHAEARREAGSLRELLSTGALDPRSQDPRRTLVELVRSESGDLAARSTPGLAPSPDGPQREVLSPGDFTRWRARAPKRQGEIGPMVEEQTAFRLWTVLDEGEDRVALAMYAVPKRSWDGWWAEVRGRVAGRPVEIVASTTGALPAPAGTQAEGALESACIADDTWDNGALGDLPEPRTDHTAIWTGNLLLVWGGMGGAVFLDSGGRYDPLTDTWTSTSTVNAPSARARHSAIWTGSAMLVWGGDGNLDTTGGRYDPASDTWTQISTANAPSGRYDHTAVWTGSAMVVWGGRNSFPLDTGATYDPVGDTWTPTSLVGAPSARAFHTAVWTGTRMIVWGGTEPTGPGSAVNTGGSYDPATDLWTPTSTVNAPTARQGHAAVWTGDRMVVWGGSTAPTGGQYDPVADAWMPTSTVDAPSPRSQHTAVWTGSRMVVWGGGGGTG